MSWGAVTYGEVGDHKARSKSLCPRGQMRIVGRKGAVDQHDIEPQIGCVVREQLDAWRPRTRLSRRLVQG